MTLNILFPDIKSLPRVFNLFIWINVYLFVWEEANGLVSRWSCEWMIKWVNEWVKGWMGGESVPPSNPDPNLPSRMFEHLFFHELPNQTLLPRAGFSAEFLKLSQSQYWLKAFNFSLFKWFRFYFAIPNSSLKLLLYSKILLNNMSLNMNFSGNRLIWYCYYYYDYLKNNETFKSFLNFL